MGDDVVGRTAGEFGRWQAGLCVLLSLLKLPIAWFQLNVLVLDAPVPFHCAGHDPPQPGVDACSIDNRNDTPIVQGNASGAAGCSQWQYSKDVFTETIVTQWDLVCGRAYLADVAQASFMLGVLVGNVVFGTAADRFGRKAPLMVAVALQAGFGVACSFAAWFPLFVALRFLLAVATGGTMIISFVLIMEVVGDSWRTTVSILYQVPFSFGVVAMAGVAYLQRDWRYFHLTLSCLSAIFLLYYWLIPESPRWLLAVGRNSQAAQVLESAARWNRRPVSEVRNALPCVHAEGPRLKADKAGFADLMRSPNLRRNSLCLFCCWFLAGLNFFGLSQVMGRLGDNIFVTIALSGVIGLPGILLALYIVKFGRRRAIIISQITAGISCLLVTVVPKGVFPGDWPLVGLSAVALTSMSILFPALYLLSGEIFPTVVRNVGLGSASMFSRLGSILAPFVKSLAAHGDYVPMLVLGVSMLVGAGTILQIPETEGCRLPDSIQDGEKFGKRNEDDERNANYLPLAVDQTTAS